MLAAGLLLGGTPANAATSATLSLSDNGPGQSGVTYTASIAGLPATAIRCIVASFNTAPDGSGTVPAGMVTTSASWPALVGWTLDRSVNGTLRAYSGTTYFTPSDPQTLQLTNVTNGSTTSTTYFMLVVAYSSAGCTGPIESARASYSWGEDLVGSALTTATVEVAPALSFTVGSHAGDCNGLSQTGGSTATSVSLGRLNAAANGSAAQGVTVATNAVNGATIYVAGEGWSGLSDAFGNKIDDWTGSNAAPTAFPPSGVEAFGYTTDDATLSAGSSRFSGTMFAALTSSFAEVTFLAPGAFSAAQCVGYRVGVASSTEAGSYVGTIRYLAVPTF